MIAQIQILFEECVCVNVLQKLQIYYLHEIQGFFSLLFKPIWSGPSAAAQ